MRRHSFQIIAALLAPLVLLACDQSTLSSSKSNLETRRMGVANSEQAGVSDEADDHDHEPIDFSEVSDHKQAPKMKLSTEQWKERLSPEAYEILRNSGTERAFSGELLRHKGEGVYVCGGCGKPLFSSETKFKSGTGWPSFYDAVEDGTVGLVKDTSYGQKRIEVYCTHCGGHLGHVFNDGPAPTGLRYCINSEAMSFESADAKE